MTSTDVQKLIIMRHKKHRIQLMNYHDGSLLNVV